MPSGTVGESSTSHMWRRSTYKQREEVGESDIETPHMQEKVSHIHTMQTNKRQIYGLRITIHAKEGSTSIGKGIHAIMPKQETGSLRRKNTAHGKCEKHRAKECHRSVT